MGSTRRHGHWLGANQRENVFNPAGGVGVGVVQSRTRERVMDLGELSEWWLVGLWLGRSGSIMHDILDCSLWKVSGSRLELPSGLRLEFVWKYR